MSHERAMDKAESEYKKYQAKTLLLLEKDYLESDGEKDRKKGEG